MKFRMSGAVGRIILLACLLTTIGCTADSAPADAPQLHVSGHRLVSENGSTVVLHGVDRSGTEYECVQGKGIFTGPSDQASITAMKSWGINAVRVPLNEACWNGEPYVDPAYAGVNYQKAIEAYVGLLNSNGIVAILDLQWTDGRYAGKSSGCVSAEAICLKPMPDAAESVPFWSSVATTFKDDDAVIFDLFNEPYPDSALPSQAAAWECWLKGGSSCSPGISYTAAGSPARRAVLDPAQRAGESLGMAPAFLRCRPGHVHAVGP
jgi:endoglucanase